MHHLRIETNLVNEAGESVALGPYGPFRSADIRNTRAWQFDAGLKLLNDYLGLEGPSRISFSWGSGGQFDEDEIEPPQPVTEMMKQLLKIYKDSPVKVRTG